MESGIVRLVFVSRGERVSTCYCVELVFVGSHAENKAQK